MARIYVVEPGGGGGVAAMGASILVGALRANGQDVHRIRLDDDAADTPSLFPVQGRAASAASLPMPDAWYISLLTPRSWLRLPELFGRIGVPLWAAERTAAHPIVVAGGQSMIAPAPIRPFFDAVALGDGEVTGLSAAHEMSGTKQARLDRLAALPGWLAFGASGTLCRVEGGAPTPRLLLTPGGRSQAVELARGCASKCAFCPIGWAGGRYREADRDAVRKIIAEASPMMALNLYAPDFSTVSWADEAEEAAVSQGCRPAGRDARLDRTLARIKAGQEHTNGKSYSFGIEGVSARLRVAISKPLSVDDIIETMKALNGRVRVVTWYLIIGLPGETSVDREEFATLLAAVREVYHGRLELTLTPFQPVPHTPIGREDAHWNADAYQWALDLRAALAAGDKGSAGRTMATNPKGRETTEHDAWLQRAGEWAAPYIASHGGRQVGESTAARDSWVASGKWRRRAPLVEETLAPMADDTATAWDYVDVGTKPEHLAAARRTYWRRLASAPPSG